MGNFARKTRQRIILGYLADTGRNMFVPEEFVTWLLDHPEHEMYKAFHGRDDELLWQAKLDLARQLASGLRIVVKQEEVQQSEVVSIKVAEYPAYISPVAQRKEGGGYEPFDPDDEASQEELRRQAGVALAAWLNRFRGSAEHIGLDMTPIENIVRILRDDKDEAVGA